MNPSSLPTHDLAIVGAGPVGIELAIACTRASLNVVHFDAGQIGQTMFNWPPATRWFSSSDRIAIAGVAGTAVAGTQRSGVRVFLENCHIHVDRIVAALTGASPPTDPDPVRLAEA